MDDCTGKVILDDFCYTDLNQILDAVKQIATGSNNEKYKETSLDKLLQSCIKMLTDGKNALEQVEKECCVSSIIVTDLISYEIGVTMSFKHCSESNLIYGDSLNNVKELLTEMFKKTSEIQTLFFNILEKVNFDFKIDGNLNLLLDALKHIWHAAKAVHSASNKVMASNWKVYITMSQKYLSQLKENIVNDEPIEFFCAEIKKTVMSFHHNDESSLKLSTYMMSVLVKLCSYGRMLESHNSLVELLLFLNCYWLPETQDTIAIKKRLLEFVNKLVLISDETFLKVYQSVCNKIYNENSFSKKVSALFIAKLLLNRFIEIPCKQQSFEVILIIFQIIKCTDLAMCFSSINIYEQLLINLASVILVSDYELFEKVEKILIKNVLSTDYWPALFSSDLWIAVTRYLSPDMRIVQFSKLARIYEALAGLQCFTQCPQHIYIEMLLKRHFALITDKKQLVNTCPQFKMLSLKSAVGILHVPSLSKYDRLSELIKVLNVLPHQKNIDHLNEDILHLWDCVRDEHPPHFMCALIEVSISSKQLLQTVIPKVSKILSSRTIDDTTEMKRYKLKLVQAVLLFEPFQEKLITDVFLKCLFDPHPLVQQWTVETIVYFSSVTGNQNKLISMLFKQPQIRNLITEYLEMKINHACGYNDKVKFYELLSQSGKFQHKCSFNDKIESVLDRLKIDVDCLNNIVSKSQMSADELKQLNKCSSLLNNLCKTAQLQIYNI